ncbi:hypothetical protein Q3O60_16455 [Alkalimonas collagenimarina]|uniref:Uncharacterized protein n=1 Tax=Alkalimonas collagenimarina TaxID=400390 RepID=A0ABT9H3A0_9GAMM|nr:hypothetical protein [Alkalimonas collagenimarina]MDP4537776.1 hypothetical protein [Alkalimonas collagenimarina]
MMNKRKKPSQQQKKRMLNVNSSRRRIGRNVDMLKLHRRRRNYQALNWVPADNAVSPGL